MSSAFWSDHQAALDSPEYARAFAAESVRIATVDSIMNIIAEQVEAAGMSKAALARAIGANPAAVRRLLSAENVNPTLGTLAEVAAALGMKVTLEPMSAAERETITKPMTEVVRQKRTARTGERTTKGKKPAAKGHRARRRSSVEELISA